MNVVMEKPTECIGGTVKKIALTKVISGHLIIGTPLQFAQYANEICEFILLHYT